MRDQTVGEMKADGKREVCPAPLISHAHIVSPHNGPISRRIFFYLTRSETKKSFRWRPALPPQNAFKDLRKS